MATSEKKLNCYIWHGINRSGQNLTGESKANNIAAVKAELLRQGILSKKIRKKQPSLLSFKNKSITQADITIFSRQLAIMITSGIPLIKAFEILERGQTNKKMITLIISIKKNVESGTSFTDALKKEPHYFNQLFCNLVAAGEQSGSLDIMLDKIATYKEKIESIKGKIKKALFYPAAIIAVALFVTTALLIFVVPQFENLFQDFGADLPTMTRMVIRLSAFFQTYWWLILSGLLLSCYSFYQAHIRFVKFAYTIDKLILNIPIIGTVLRKAAVTRFARTLSITFAAGLPLVDALTSVAGTTGNILYAKASLNIRDEVSTGQQMHLAMNQTKLFPQMVIQMIAIGEESGSLEKMLSKIADIYEEQVDNTIDGLSSLLEPLIMTVLSVFVGGLIIAMYLPIFKLSSVM